MLKGAEPAFIKTVDPVIRDSEVAANAFSSRQQAESSPNLVDDSVPLVDANGKS